MSNYIVKRIFASFITLWIVVTATFFLMHAMPGGPFDGEKKLPDQVKANLETKFGLDKPIMQQYGLYLKNLLKGDLGPSIKYEGRTVNEIIKYSFPASAKIGSVAILFSLVVGIYMGIVAALHQGKWQDDLCMIIATLGVTVPSFVLSTFLILIFSVKLKLLPPVGFDGPLNYIMPAIALGGYSLSFIARLTRSSLLDVIRQDYIRTAVAKGLSKKTVIFKHALRNALIPIVTYMGPLIAGILTGSFVVEKIFGIPGLGREFVQNITNRDYMAIMGVTVFYSAFLVICNLVVDILYAFIDPRIKLE
ncbi:MAG TPA: peptide ABC transporter permease [Clostridiaceae bacterium]|jgi:oligopeptide transport system permease protein|nr:peptide ABC transporter permease [Clostridiaceae bacterium]HBF77043.1 peptide ABC transporter permease [Clostridiaceae bacterium]HBG38750.1 peptide ABC transporter permease [Clostridiaceae bacterium]HBN27830.1 peptide ABC transporter permease [Clostridiaceae bacterium]HBX47487.1 peptide ABC transporter permease [Clostridiaceae bacterium]